MDPTDVGTPDQLAGCLDDLRQRRGLSYADITRAATKLARQPGRAAALPKSTVGDICTGKTVPSDETLRAFLAVCDVSAEDQLLWLAAAKRARTADTERPRGAGRVADSNPRDLGVHAAIHVDDAAGELPDYVARDLDAQLRERLRAGAAERGCFVLLVGGSSVGKTRCAYEAVRDVVPQWWLFHPSNAAELRAFAVQPTPRTVLWLDEIQRYLNTGLTAATIRAVRSSRHPTLVVGTLWPDLYHRFTTRGATDMEDPFARHRELIDLAVVITVEHNLSNAERNRAEKAAAMDARLAKTVNSRYGMTQALAAAPELVRRWEAAPTPYAWAVITAAVDARRMGALFPLTGDLLRVAVPGYLTPVERGRAPADWFETALAYATTEVHGAASPLAPFAADMGAITGYTAADYLLHHGTQTRATAVPPDTAWTAYQDHLTDGLDLLATADAAYHRMLDGPAEHLYRKAATADEPEARRRLAYLLQEQGRTDEAVQMWRQAVAADDAGARAGLADLLRELERDEEAVQVWVDAVAAGDTGARAGLAGFLNKEGRHHEAVYVWRLGVAAGDIGARAGLAGVLLHLALIEEAEQVWREAVAAGEAGARAGLARFLNEIGRHHEAVIVLQEAVLLGDTRNSDLLAFLLHEKLGRSDWAEEVLRYAIWQSALPSVLEKAGMADLTQHVLRYTDAEAAPKAWKALVWLLESLERIDEAVQVWRDAIAADIPRARTHLAHLLRRAGRYDEAEAALRDAITAGDPMARTYLEHLLERLERTDEAIMLWRNAITANIPRARYHLAYLLEKAGRDEEAKRTWLDAVAAGDEGAREALEARMAE